jgi:hypothetical protein
MKESLGGAENEIRPSSAARDPSSIPPCDISVADTRGQVGWNFQFPCQHYCGDIRIDQGWIGCVLLSADARG